MTREERLKRDGALNPILFYRGSDPEWGFMSSFSRYLVLMPDPFTGVLETYETREHRYQACKAVSEAEHRWVRDASGPSEAKDRGRSVMLRKDWGNKQGDVCWHVMVESIFTVCIQWPDVLEALMATGRRTIYENSPTDDIWGWRFQQTYNGKNLLGLAWMYVRDVFGARHLVVQ